MAAIRLPDGLSDLVRDSRFPRVVFQNQETVKSISWATLGTTNWTPHGLWYRRSANAVVNPMFEIVPGTETATGCDLSVAVAPGDGQQYIVGMTIKKD